MLVAGGAAARSSLLYRRNIRVRRPRQRRSMAVRCTENWSCGRAEDLPPCPKLNIQEGVWSLENPGRAQCASRPRRGAPHPVGVASSFLPSRQPFPPEFGCRAPFLFLRAGWDVDRDTTATIQNRRGFLTYLQIRNSHKWRHSVCNCELCAAVRSATIIGRKSSFKEHFP